MIVGTRTSRLLVFALIVCCGLAQAKTTPEARLELSPATTAAQFESQRADLAKAMAKEDHYVELRAADRKGITDRLDRIGARLATAGSLAQLSADERETVLAEQEELNQLLDVARVDSRLVCTREKEIGSSFRRSVCLTVAERRRQSEAGRGIVREQTGG